MKTISLKSFCVALLFIVVAFNISFVGSAYAITGANTGSSDSSSGITKLTNPLSKNFDSIGGLIQGFVEIFSYIVILGAVLALVYVGLRFILARGNPTEMTVLKDWLFWIVVGVAVVIGARLIIQVVINTLSASGTVDQKTIQSVQKAVSGN